MEESSQSTLGSMHCPKSHPNFHDITWNVVENMILLEKFRVNHVLPATVHVISRKNWFSLWQCGCFRKMDNPLVHTTPNHHPPKMEVLPKLFFKSSLLLNGQWGIQVRPPNSNDDFSLFFCLFLLLSFQLTILSSSALLTKLLSQKLPWHKK